MINKCKLIGTYVYWLECEGRMYMDVCVTFKFVSFVLVMLKCHGYQHNYILIYAV